MKALAGTSRTQIPRVSSAMVKCIGVVGLLTRCAAGEERLEVAQRREMSLLCCGQY